MGDSRRKRNMNTRVECILGVYEEGRRDELITGNEIKKKINVVEET